jgi:hypothetical protein
MTAMLIGAAILAALIALKIGGEAFGVRIDRRNRR